LAQRAILIVAARDSDNPNGGRSAPDSRHYSDRYLWEFLPVFTLGFLLTTCYIPGWTGYTIPTGWILLSVTLPFILRREIWKLANPFFLWACLSMMWTMVFVQGVYGLWVIAILSTSFILGQMPINPRRLWIGLSLGLSVSSVLALVQAWTDSGILYTAEGQYSAPAGLFVNPNYFGETAALISVAILTSGIWWPLLWTVPSILLSGSRTGLLAFVVIAMAWSVNRYISILLIVFMASFAFLKPLDTFGYRWEIWKSAFSGLTFLGRGVGSYAITSPVFSPFHSELMPNREETPHNDFLFLAYEYGLGAALLLPVLAVGLFGPLSPERSVFLAFCIIACFNFPLSIPAEGFLGAFAMGRLWARRDLSWSLGLYCRRAKRRRMATEEV
jgi:hypothetical protein